MYNVIFSISQRAAINWLTGEMPPDDDEEDNPGDVYPKRIDKQGEGCCKASQNDGRVFSIDMGSRERIRVQLLLVSG